MLGKIDSRRIVFYSLDAFTLVNDGVNTSRNTSGLGQISNAFTSNDTGIKILGTCDRLVDFYNFLDSSGNDSFILYDNDMRSTSDSFTACLA